MMYYDFACKDIQYIYMLCLNVSHIFQHLRELIHKLKTPEKEGKFVLSVVAVKPLIYDRLFLKPDLNLLYKP